MKPSTLMAFPTPSVWLATYKLMHPKAYQAVAGMRNLRAKLGGWPDWCFLPMAGTTAVLTEGAPAPGEKMRRLGTDIACVSGLSAWRVSQGVYTFDDDLYEAVASTALDLKKPVPYEVLFRLPEWCCWIETPDAPESNGFFVSLEHDVNGGAPELRLLVSYRDNLVPVVLHLVGRTLQDGLDAMVANVILQAGAIPSSTVDSVSTATAELLRRRLPLILYLCSDEPDLELNGEPSTPARPTTKNTRKGEKFFPPDSPRLWTVGRELGNQLRAARTAGEAGSSEDGGSRKAHIRRAHWHTYWVGPKASQRAELRWIYPMLVSARDGDGA